jgi:uncharacterized membrane protein YdjX (TVP38/TMEM64 family)
MLIGYVMIPFLPNSVTMFYYGGFAERRLHRFTLRFFAGKWPGRLSLR